MDDAGAAAFGAWPHVKSLSDIAARAIATDHPLAFEFRLRCGASLSRTIGSQPRRCGDSGKRRGTAYADSNSGNCSRTCSAMTVRRHGLHWNVCVSRKMRFAGAVCKKRMGWPQLGHAIKRSVSARSISVPSHPKHIKLILSDSLRRRIGHAANRRALFERAWSLVTPGSLLQPHFPAISLMGAGAMSNQGSATFGVTDRPACPNCGQRPYLTRRSPHPDHDLRYELQIFTCSTCDHTLERIVDANGNPPAELKCGD
jgi:hypothetical protein